MSERKHPEKVLALLESIAEEQREIEELGRKILMADGGNLFQMDFLVIGAVKRFVSNSAAFRRMIADWNLTTARSILRLHIDTGLRFSAAWLVADPHEFASKVLGGESINRLKDLNGRRLTDAFLVERRSSEFPWLPIVYENLCGFIHFSGSHIFASVKEIESDSRTVNFKIGEKDLNYPEFSWVEVIEYYSMATEILRKPLAGYLAIKCRASSVNLP